MLWYGSVSRALPQIEPAYTMDSCDDVQAQGTILTLFQSTTSGIDWRDCYLPLEQSALSLLGGPGRNDPRLSCMAHGTVCKERLDELTECHLHVALRFRAGCGHVPGVRWPLHNLCLPLTISRHLLQRIHAEVHKPHCWQQLRPPDINPFREFMPLSAFQPEVWNIVTSGAQPCTVQGTQSIKSLDRQIDVRGESTEAGPARPGVFGDGAPLEGHTTCLTVHFFPLPRQPENILSRFRGAAPHRGRPGCPGTDRPLLQQGPQLDIGRLL